MKGYISKCQLANIIKEYNSFWEMPITDVSSVKEKLNHCLVTCFSYKSHFQLTLNKEGHTLLYFKCYPQAT